MCGRYIVTSPVDVLKARFFFGFGDAAGTVSLPRFNAAPRQALPVVIRSGTGRLLRPMSWGLVPSWTKDLAAANRPINARSETVTEKPSFRGLLKERRALVPADGFYEWGERPDRKRKVPFLFKLAAPGAFAMAGLFDVWKAPDGALLETFTILTVSANPLVGLIHERMPVILSPENEAVWLEGSVKDALGAISSFPEGLMDAWEVSTEVNSPSIDRQECLESRGSLR